MRKKRKILTLATVLWAGFTAVTALAMLSIPLGAEPGAGLLRHSIYALRYGGAMGLFRAAVVCLVALAASLLWAWSLPKAGKNRWGALLSALFFAWNTVIWLSPRSPRALDGLLLLPGVRPLEMLLFYGQLVGNDYALVMTACLWLNSRKVGREAGRGSRWPIYAGVILLGWLPILILRSPGSLYVDTAIQILMYHGNYHFHASMPVLLTVTYGLLFDLGRWLAGDNGGILICMLAQLVLLSYAMTMACREVELATGKWKNGLLLSLFFGLVPVYPSMAQGIIKDAIHSAFYLLFVICFFRAVRGGQKKELWRLLLLGALVGATRKGGIYLAVLSLALLSMHRKNWRRQLLLVAAVLAAGSGIFNQFVYPALGIDRPWQRENYSFFYPITAYYCQMHRQEMTPEEIQAVSDVLDFETACTGYSTTMVDDVKNTFHANNQSQVRTFLIQNGRFFGKHPLTCLEAVVYSKNLYYTPFSLGGQTMYPTQTQFQGIADGVWSDFSFFLPEQLRQAGEETLEAIQSFLPVRLLCGPGLYSWLCVILLVAAAQDHRKQIRWALLPVTLLTAGLLLSHINGAVRYAMPEMIVVPFLWALYPAGKEAK